MRARGRALATMLVVCGVLASIAVGGLFPLNVIYERQTAIQVARRAGSNLAQSLAAGLGCFCGYRLRTARLADRLQAERDAGSGELGPSARERVATWMAMQVTMVPRMHELVVVDARRLAEVSNVSAASGSRRYLAEVSYLRAHPHATDRISETSSNGRKRPEYLRVATPRTRRWDVRRSGHR